MVSGGFSGTLRQLAIAGDTRAAPARCFGLDPLSLPRIRQKPPTVLITVGGFWTKSCFAASTGIEVSA
jgi:hypothetical protein